MKCKNCKTEMKHLVTRPPMGMGDLSEYYNRCPKCGTIEHHSYWDGKSEWLSPINLIKRK